MIFERIDSDIYSLKKGAGEMQKPSIQVNIMPMKFKQIQAFITVAREVNMTLAAEKMGITQSGLSRLLLSLEADLSASLFERHKHGMALSECR